MLVLAPLVFCASLQAAPKRVVREPAPGGWTIEREVLDRASGETVGEGGYAVRDAEGRVRVEGSFYRGEKRGPWTWKDGAGRVRARGKYRDGLRHGAWSFRWPEGEKRAEGEYEDGVKQGTWSYWHPDGSDDEAWSGRWRGEVERHGSGALRSRTLLLDGQRHGPLLSWWPDGRVQVVGGWLAGRRAGSWNVTHADGTRDPEVLAFEGEPLAHAELEHEPLPRSAFGDGEAPPEEPPAEVLGEVPPLGPSASLAEAERAELERALSELRDAPDRRPELGQALVEGFGVDAALSAVDALKRVDLALPDDVAWGGALVEHLLAPSCSGRSYGWSPGTDAVSQQANRLSVLRWNTLLALVADDEAAWNLDLALPAGPHDTLLMQPLFGTLMEWLGTQIPAAHGRFGMRVPRDDVFAVIDEALGWLVRHQSADGRWDAEGFGERCPAESRCDGPGEAHDVGCTGLALLALLASGLDGQPERLRAVQRGTRWLIGQQEPASGQLVTTPLITSMYDHAIATIALCEVAWTHRTPAVLEAARNATAFVQRARNPYSAWRYWLPSEIPTGEKDLNDTSVTAWMVCALKSAEECGIEVEPEAYAGALAWIDEVTDPATGRVGYVSIGSESSRVANVNDHFPRNKGEALTAAGLLCRVFLGQVPEQEPLMIKHAELLARKPPTRDAALGNDMYYWYYGTYAMYQMGGAFWERWNQEMRTAVVDSQRKDGDSKGSWDPIGPWGFAGGRVYSTALMALCLEVPSRYARILRSR